jgi:hypothetical protein
MASKDMNKMKELIEAKKQKQSDKQNLIPNKKIGSSRKESTNMKTGGSNNKV